MNYFHLHRRKSNEYKTTKVRCTALSILHCTTSWSTVTSRNPFISLTASNLLQLTQNGWISFSPSQLLNLYFIPFALPYIYLLSRYGKSKVLATSSAPQYLCCNHWITSYTEAGREGCHICTETQYNAQKNRQVNNLFSSFMYICRPIPRITPGSIPEGHTAWTRRSCTQPISHAASFQQNSPALVEERTGTPGCSSDICLVSCWCCSMPLTMANGYLQICSLVLASPKQQHSETASALNLPLIRSHYRPEAKSVFKALVQSP